MPSADGSSWSDSVAEAIDSCHVETDEHTSPAQLSVADGSSPPQPAASAATAIPVTKNVRDVFMAPTLLVAGGAAIVRIG